MASTTLPNFDVPNPLTPMAFLEPGIAGQVMNGLFIHIGILAVVVWDGLHNIRNDHLLATKHRLGVPTAAYFLSRIACLIYALGRAFLLTIPIAHCRRVELAIDSFLTICLCLNTLLFYVRVCAVYYNKHYIVVGFGIFWLATVGVSCLIPRAMTAIHIGPTRHCVEIVDTHSLIPTYLVFFSYDSAIFLATAYRFYKLYTQEETSIPTGLRVVFLGASMPAFSKAMLHESQLYYMAVPLIKLGIIIGAFCFSADTPGLVVVSNLVPAHVMLANVVTCRVFRNTKLGLVREPIDRHSESLPRSTRHSSRAAGMQFSTHSHVRSGGKSEDREVKDLYETGKDGKSMNMSLLAVRKETNTFTVIDYPSPMSDGGFPVSPSEASTKM
ncbi:unnamed protein product [Cyclocybe aegerita]|uniref:Uncharacterized protein n=1 Tax=Cyclocybe aegerita TaxID=1973307 RepID=A0A8S0WHM4_CYCAE|nr:unnamed protein product [Cyclocybe aegerita]